MIIVLKRGATKEQADELLSKIEKEGLKSLYMPGSERTVLGALGDERVLGRLHLESHPLVESVKQILAPYKLVSREVRAHDTIVTIGSMSVGGDRLAVIAGPCAVESHEQLLETAQHVKKAGAMALRGGAFKPRTSPYAFQGLGREGLEILREVSRETGLPTVTEVVEVADVAAVVEYADALQVGARNMQNYRLLKELGGCGKPVILKRGMAATIKDLLMAAEYIVSEGNEQVVLCERGIRTFETATRNTLDLNAIPFIKQHSHLPVIVDPSHGTGVRDLVSPMARAAVACGADGIMVEVHRNPAEALSDGAQSLFPAQFAELMHGLKGFAAAAGKKFVEPS
jgi:3-deoxy-7-phosphoheptulonate synthase